MDRRRFLRHLATLGGLTAAAPIVQACSRLPRLGLGAATETAATSAAPTIPAQVRSTAPPADTEPAATGASTDASTDAPTAAPTETPRDAATERPATGVATVALVSTTDRGWGVRRAIELLGTNPVRGRHVLVKPNYNSADPAPGSTHDDVLRALLGSLSDMGARSMSVGDRSGMGDTRAVMEQLGVLALSDTFGFEPVVFDELPEDAWAVINGDGYHWSRGFLVPKILRDAERVVQTCNLKTHSHGGHFTLSLKNSVGFAAKIHGSHDYMKELHAGPDQRKMIAEVNSGYTPSLVVIDGVEAFVRGGPDTGTLASTGIVLAGTDRVALDAVGVAVLRLYGTTPEVSRGQVFDQEQIARAVELGLGVDTPSKIAFATGDAASEAYAARITEVLTA